MKQKDYVIIGIVVLVSIVISVYVSNYLFSTPVGQAQEVTTVSAVNPNLQSTNSQFFNSQSIDPSQLIGIGIGSNQTPFQTPNTTQGN